MTTKSEKQRKLTSTSRTKMRRFGLAHTGVLQEVLFNWNTFSFCRILRNLWSIQIYHLIICLFYSHRVNGARCLLYE